MMFVLAGLVALGAWFTVQDEIRDEQRLALDASTVIVKVYAPIETIRRCRRVNDEPVFRDLEPPASH